MDEKNCELYIKGLRKLVDEYEKDQMNSYKFTPKCNLDLYNKNIEKMKKIIKYLQKMKMICYNVYNYHLY